jgi:hypothetical protein
MRRELAAADGIGRCEGAGNYGIMVRDDGKKQWTYKAQLMYESAGGERLTLTVKHAAQHTDQTGFDILERNGTSVFYWIDQRYGYALSGNIDKPRLLSIAQAVEMQLKRW